MLSFRILQAGLASLAVTAAVAALSPAEAGARTGTWRNGMVQGDYGPGYYSDDGYYYGEPRRRQRGRVYREYPRERYDQVPGGYGGYDFNPHSAHVPNYRDPEQWGR
jgi:hypothetical protein